MCTVPISIIDSLTFVCIATVLCGKVCYYDRKTIVHVIMNNDNKPPSLIIFWEFSDGKLHPQLEWPYVILTLEKVKRISECGYIFLLEGKDNYKVLTTKEFFYSTLCFSVNQTALIKLMQIFWTSNRTFSDCSRNFIGT